MCGIAGEVTFGRVPPARQQVRAMCARLTHRGPDEEGFHDTDAACLGIRRLKIVALENGSQPVFGASGRTACVFNGEIYNFVELRRELEREGVPFRTSGDGEVIVAGYERYGSDFVHRLDGMFAFAIYDARVARLVLARDRAGKKPLFYAVDGRGTVRFSSELASLMTHAAIPRRVDPISVDRFLAHRVIPAPGTIYRDVSKVEPGTLVEFEESGAPRVRRYFAFDFTPRRDGALLEHAPRVGELLRDAVRKRLVAEVPVGAMLSGGLDSSLVVAVSREFRRDEFHTFSIGFESAAFDESAHAEVVARHCGTIHHARCIGAGDALDAIEPLVRHYGEPYAFPSAIASYYMYQLARQHVTVVLGGDGADEIFGGYDRYRTFAALPALPEEPRLRRRVDLALLERAGADPRELYRAVLTDGLRDELKDRLYASAFRREVGPFPRSYLRERFPEGPGPRQRLDWALEVDCNFWLRDAQLVKIDIASMAHSVEVRSPMLDGALVEYVSGIGHQAKMDASGKALLRHVARRWLPDSIIDRRKQELAVPLELWMTSALRDEIARTLTSEAALSRGYFEPDRVRELVADPRPELAYPLWTLYMLEKWHCAFC